MASTVSTRYVTSRDGTRIGYLQRGHGPGVLLVQGAMADARAYDQLADAMSVTFEVSAVDRRGRGLSPKAFDRSHDITRDVEDIDAVLADTGAHLVFGLSSGAVITLEAARRLDRITSAAIYEPPLYADYAAYNTGVARLNAEIDRGAWGLALVDALVVAGTAPSPIRLLPRPMARTLARAVLAIDARVGGDRASLRDLLPGVRYDFADVASVDGRLAELSRVDKPVLLLSGTKSPAFLREGVRTLERLLPQRHRVEFAGLGHDGPWGGAGVADIASAITDFWL